MTLWTGQLKCQLSFTFVRSTETSRNNFASFFFTGVFLFSFPLFFSLFHFVQLAGGRISDRSYFHFPSKCEIYLHRSTYHVELRTWKVFMTFFGHVINVLKNYRARYLLCIFYKKRKVLKEFQMALCLIKSDERYRAPIDASKRSFFKPLRTGTT